MVRKSDKNENESDDVKVIAYPLIVIGFVFVFFIILNPEYGKPEEFYALIAVGMLFTAIGIILVLLDSDIISFKKPISDQELRNIIELINKFTPARNWETEDGYHKNLLGYLQVYYPNIQYEFQEGASRPDLVINNVAIEIKGPTYSKDLDTIASKCLRYPQYFEHLLMVLFDLRASSQYYNEWKMGMEKHHPNVIIIVK